MLTASDITKNIMNKPTKKEKRLKLLKSREEGFSMGHVHSKNQVSYYNALYDPNMRHYFENKHVQTLLYNTGQIDRHGRVIDLHKNAGKYLYNILTHTQTIEII